MGDGRGGAAYVDRMEIVVALLAATGAVLGSFLSVSRNAAAERDRATLLLKREVCLDALAVVDGIYAQQQWDKQWPDPQAPPSPAEARRCHNLLAVTCRAEVAEAYLRCFGLGLGGRRYHGGLIEEFRQVVRRECGFGDDPMSTDRQEFWIAQLGFNRAPDNLDGPPSH